MNVLPEVSGPPLTEKESERWIFDRLDEWSRQDPSRCAFVVDHPHGSEEYTFTDVLRFAERIGAALHKNGIGRGDRVGILMENIPQWVFALLGTLRIGAIGVPLATALPEAAIQRVMEHSACRLIFADAPNAEKARNVAAAARVPVVALNSTGDGLVAWDTFLDSGTSTPPFPTNNADETALLIYTSGTTGDPKAVQLTTRNLVCEIPGVIEVLEISSDHRILSVLPFSHVLPLVANGLGPLWVGAAVVFLSSVSPQRIVEAFHKHRISFFVCVPQFFYMLHRRIFSEIDAQPWLVRTIFRRMFRIAGWVSDPKLRRKLFAKIHRKIGPDLRLLASGGSRFDSRIAEDLSRLGYTVVQAYGLTETAAAATATPVRQNVIGTVGKPIRGVSIRIDSPDGQGIGEVWIRGPIVMKGYYRNEEETNRVMPDGWLHSGDLGYIRPDGNLVITGRSKDVIVLANGKNIYPEEMEAHYSQSPFVKEICVMGIAEDSNGFGEKLHAVVVPDMEFFKSRAQTAIMETIKFELENLSRQLPSYQRVLSLAIRNEPFPRTVTRKLKRFEIQTQELNRRNSAAPTVLAKDHPRFDEGAGAVVAALVREAKPDAGSLDVAMNLELDLGFDSLARVELLGLAEARLGLRVDEKDAAQIFTLGELVDVLSASQSTEAGRGRSWKEILNSPADEELQSHEAFDPAPMRRLVTYTSIKIVKLVSMVLFRLRWSGLEKLPKNLPFMLCPNHESYLDGPLLISVLPRRVIDKIFTLGYTDYWVSPVMSWLAKVCNIVQIDPNVNLVKAMQLGAVGLRKNHVLLVFPEGTRTIDGRVAEFKKGASIIAFEMDVPVVPVGIRGGFEMWPRGGSFRLHRPIELIFGDPIYPRDFANAADPYLALSEALREKVRKLSGDGV